MERVVGRDYLITVTGAGIDNPEGLWNRILDWMDAPHSRTSGTATSGKVGAELGIEG